MNICLRIAFGPLFLLPVLTTASVGQGVGAPPAPMAPGKWVLSQSNEEPKTDTERKSMCSNPVGWVEVSEKSWIDGDSGGRRVCVLPKWKVNGATYLAPSMKCKPAVEADGDGDGSISALVKGPKSVEINNALFIRCD
ncbi:hypothetical protein EJ105_27315 [Xanthobacter aminoxidans]|uniref:hypothetical protein n=1 Tax=Xanthobacter aminoxidans TaxID=186280 RepID=UPI002022C3F4|nr:hypothetical protein [Xanthobacter aminoxidans]MCL8385874.1 hypothetical protein [Xanthobacter aminoxidans]